MANFSQSNVAQASAFALIESTGVGSLAGIRAAAAKRLTATTAKNKKAVANHRAKVISDMRKIVAGLVDKADAALDSKVRANLVAAGFSQLAVSAVDADWKAMVLDPNSAQLKLADLEATGGDLEKAFVNTVRPLLNDIVKRRDNYVASYASAKKTAKQTKRS